MLSNLAGTPVALNAALLLPPAPFAADEQGPNLPIDAALGSLPAQILPRDAIKTRVAHGAVK